MAFSLLSSCWHYFHRETHAHEEELPCEEEEEAEQVDPVCWVVGEIVLFYCLAMALLKMVYLGLEWMHKNRHGGVLASGYVAKSSGGKQDGRQKGSGVEEKVASCACCWACRFGIRGLFRKAFGEPKKASPESPSSSASLQRRLSKRLSRLSQQTFCNSDSSETASLGSQLASWRASRTEDSLSVVSLKGKEKGQVAEAPGSHWTRDHPCLHCKAQRTEEWLAQHFYVENPPPQRELLPKGCLLERMEPWPAST